MTASRIFPLHGEVCRTMWHLSFTMSVTSATENLNRTLVLFESSPYATDSSFCCLSRSCCFVHGKREMSCGTRRPQIPGPFQPSLRQLTPWSHLKVTSFANLPIHIHPLLLFETLLGESSSVSFIPSFLHPNWRETASTLPRSLLLRGGPSALR